jgi:DNA-binding NtrC family response regulator
LTLAVNIPCSLPTRLPKRLLLAEDDVDLRALLSIALRREGYEVIEVSTGEGLVASLQDSDGNGPAIDVILTDVRMPKKSGLEALAWMRGSMLRIPTIVISAFCDHAVHVKARGLGALAVLEKPVELGQLRSVLRTYFENKESVH